MPSLAERKSQRFRFQIPPVCVDWKFQIRGSHVKRKIQFDDSLTD